MLTRRQWLLSKARRFMSVHHERQRYGDAVWVANYFIRKVDADRLEAGEKIDAKDLRIYGYGDLGSDPSGRLRRGEPDALVACDMRIARTW